MTREQLQRAVEAWLSKRRTALAKLPDETAVDVTVLFEPWQPWHEYAADQRVRDGDKLYRVVQSHTSQPDWRPADATALFVEIAKPGEIPEWKQPMGAIDAYNKGDRVKHSGFVWVSQVDGNVWEPGVYGWDKE